MLALVSATICIASWFVQMNDFVLMKSSDELLNYFQLTRSKFFLILSIFKTTAYQAWGQFCFVNSNSQKSIPIPSCKKSIPIINSNSNFLNPRLRKNSNPVCFNSFICHVCRIIKMAFSHLICTFCCDTWIFANQTFWTALDSWVVNLSYISCGIIDISSNLL